MYDVFGGLSRALCSRLFARLNNEVKGTRLILRRSNRFFYLAGLLILQRCLTYYFSMKSTYFMDEIRRTKHYNEQTRNKVNAKMYPTRFTLIPKNFSIITQVQDGNFNILMYYTFIMF